MLVDALWAPYRPHDLLAPFSQLGGFTNDRRRFSHLLLYWLFDAMLAIRLTLSYLAASLQWRPLSHSLTYWLLGSLLAHWCPLSFSTFFFRIFDLSLLLCTLFTRSPPPPGLSASSWLLNAILDCFAPSSCPPRLLDFCPYLSRCQMASQSRIAPLAFRNIYARTPCRAEGGGGWWFQTPGIGLKYAHQEPRSSGTLSIMLLGR